MEEDDCAGAGNQQSETMTVIRYLIGCKGKVCERFRIIPTAGLSFLIWYLRRGPNRSEGRFFSYISNNCVKQLLITGSQSIFCSPFEKYHEKVRLFLKVGTAFGLHKLSCMCAVRRTPFKSKINQP
jgi:hypothetical protein